MRRLPLIRSIVATLFGFGIAAVAGATVAAPPALADGPCCQVSIQGLPQQFHAGAGAENFQVTVTNSGQDQIDGISVTLSFRAAGLERSQVHLQYQRNGGWRSVGTRTQNGAIVGMSSPNSDFFRHNGVQPGQRVSFNYRLSFGAKVQSGPLSVALTVAPSGHQGQAAHAGPYQSALVGIAVANTPAPKPTLTPTPTPSETITDTPSDSSSQDAGLAGDGGTLGGTSGDGGSSMTWLAYTIGALLLIGGVGVIGTMLWRRGPQPVETEWNDPGYPQQPAGPAYQPHPQGGGYDARTMPFEQPTVAQPPAGYNPRGRHATPTAPYSMPQDPYIDETMIDPR